MKWNGSTGNRLEIPNVIMMSLKENTTIDEHKWFKRTCTFGHSGCDEHFGN